MDNKLKEVLVKISSKRVKVIKKNSFSHALVNGDCIEVLKRMPKGKVDLIITDPPYNVGLDYGNGFNDNRSWSEYEQWCKEWLIKCAQVLSDNGSLYLISYPELCARLFNFIEGTGLKFRRWLVWHYPTNIGHSSKNWTRSHRAILFFTKSNNYVFNRENILQPYKNPEVGKIRLLIEKGAKGRASYDSLKPSDLDELNYEILDFLEINLLKNVSKDRLNKKHPCQLPLELLRILMKVSSNKGDLVLDPFAGTFTLSEVAAELKRNSVGIERNPAYIKLGLRRLGRWD